MVGGSVVPGCFEIGDCIFFPCCSGRRGQERIVPHSVVGTPAFFVSLPVFARTSHSCRATNWRAVLAAACWTVEGYPTPDSAMHGVQRGVPACGWKSRVGWHSDNEPLFVQRGESKLIVSVSFGSQALYKWKGKSCPDGEAHLCCSGHGDTLVMDGQRHDEFLHCTDLGLEQERIIVTFRWTQQHTASCPKRTGVVCCLPTCAQGSSAAVTRGLWGTAFFWHSGCSLES